MYSNEKFKPQLEKNKLEVLVDLVKRRTYLERLQSDGIKEETWSREKHHPELESINKQINELAEEAGPLSEEEVEDSRRINRKQNLDNNKVEMTDKENEQTPEDIARQKVYELRAKF